MNKEQQAKLNNLLTALAAFLLSLREPVSEEKPKLGDAKPDDSADDLLGDPKPSDNDDLLGPEPTKEDKKAEKAKKKAEEEAAKAEKKKAEEEAAKKKAEEDAKKEPPKADITPTNPDQLLADCRAAAIQFAAKHGREKLREKLNAFTKGTIAEVPKDKLPDLLKALKE